ncbi:long chain acyl-coa synthetase 1 [Gossypium australe]|uniref:Long chain acyl-coa synthetase 1 n=1 Tax=Gossypium australe TaxID=47621 RepID=A0A5B6WS76_9ROSI|nr:long chain acyl-coa synthetase 1 [Gossypium australe]
MSKVPYASIVGSLMYAMLCTRPNIYFIVGMTNPSLRHWQVVKHILRYLKRTRDLYSCVFWGRTLLLLDTLTQISKPKKI